MSTVGGNIPQIPTPQILQEVKQGDYQKAAQDMIQDGSPFTEDQIVSALVFLDINNVEISQKNIDNLIAGEPILAPPNTNFDTTSGITNLSNELKTNPWLNANPFAEFTVIYLELAFKLSQAKLQEALIGADSIDQMAALARDVADLIKEQAKVESTQYIVSGIMSLASGITSMIGAVHSYRAPDSKTMAVSMGYTGISKLFEAGDSFAKAIFTLQKAELESLKTITENMQKVAERRLSGAMDEYKAQNDLLTQVLQNLQKIIDEAFKAHGWQVH